MLRSHRFLVLAVAICGCSTPGVPDLEENSVRITRTVDHPYGEVASCVFDELRYRKVGAVKLSMEPNGFRAIPGKEAIEIWNTTIVNLFVQSPNYYGYLITVTGTDNGHAHVEALARKNVHFLVPSNFVPDVVNEALSACS